jgi:hypothetical protein
MPAPAYANLTDRDLVMRTQELTLETVDPTTMLTVQFGQPNIPTALANLIAAVDQAQKDFLRDTGVVAWHDGYQSPTDNTALGVTPQTESVQLEQDASDWRRFAWIEYAPPQPTRQGPLFYLINDPFGETFRLTVNDSGIMSTSDTGQHLPAPPVQLNAVGFMANSFQLGMTPPPPPQVLVTESIPYSPLFDTQVFIQSPNLGWELFMYQIFPGAWVLASRKQGLGPPPLANIQEMPIQDAWTTDSTSPTWETDFSTPVTADESIAPVPGVFLAPPSADIGQLDSLYTPVAAALSNTGQPMSVPPDFSPGIVWRAVWIIMTSQTEGDDPVRARFCLDQYRLWVRLAKSVLAMPNLMELGAAK